MKSLGQEISIMTISTIISQIFVIFTALFLGKVLGPEAFGVYGKVFAMAILFSMYLSFKIEVSIFDSNDQEKLFRVIDSVKVLFFNSFYSLIFYYDLISTKLLTLLSYSSMLSDLAEGFAVSLILLILIVSGSVISIKVQDSVKLSHTKTTNTGIYKTIFSYLSR